MADIALGNACNNCCVMCTAPMPPRRAADPTTDQVLARLAGLREPGNIVLTGGEPTLRDDLDRIVGFARERFPRAPLLLITNGRRFAYRGYARRLVEAGLEHAAVSLCGPSARVHDSVTRSPGSFAQTVQGICNLLAAGVRTEVRYVLHRVTAPCAAEVPGLLAREAPGVARLVMMYMDIIGNAFLNRERLIVPYREVAPHLERAAAEAEAHGVPLELWHVPPCTLPAGLRHLCSGVTVEARRITFPAGCERCSRRERCCGVWRTYAKLVGVGEFEAIP